MTKRTRKPALKSAAKPTPPAAMMRAVADRVTLARAIGFAALVPELRTTVPVLQGLRFTAGGDLLEVESGDLDMALSVTMPAWVGSPGVRIAASRTLANFAKLLPPEPEVTLDGDESLLALEAGQSRAEFVRLAEPGDWPGVNGPKATDEKLCRFPIEAGELRRLLDRAALCISTEETRYYLNGIYLHPVDGAALRAAATDGHRLALVDTALPAAAAKFEGLIIPTKAVAILRRLLAAMKGEHILDITADSTRLRLEGQIGEMAVTFTTKAIDGSFPDCERVVPKAAPAASFEVDPAPMLQALKRLMAVSTERRSCVTIEAEAGWPLALSIDDPISAKAREFVEANAGGDPICIGVNGRYLEQTLRQAKGLLTFMITDPGSPMCVMDAGDPLTTLVIMPMRVDDAAAHALAEFKRKALAQPAEPARLAASPRDLANAAA